MTHDEGAAIIKACPYCASKAAFCYSKACQYLCWFEEKGSPCNRSDSHMHPGVMPPKACGRGQVSFLRWLLRNCWRRDLHFHFHCTHCGATWELPKRESAIKALPAHEYVRGFKDGVEHARREMRP